MSVAEEEDALTAALRSRVRRHGDELVVVAPDAELEKIGEAAIIAAHDGLDPVLVGRSFLSMLAARFIVAPVAEASPTRS